VGVIGEGEKASPKWVIFFIYSIYSFKRKEKSITPSGPNYKRRFFFRFIE